MQWAGQGPWKWWQRWQEWGSWRWRRLWSSGVCRWRHGSGQQQEQQRRGLGGTSGSATAGFWLLWTVLILFSCCCAFRHRRAKLRLQQQQRQREINLLAYHGACHGAGPVPTGSLLDLRLLSAFKPPAYEDVVHHPGTPPPPYTMAPGHPLTTSNECTRCSSESSCSAHSEGTSVEGVSSNQSALPPQEGEPRAGVSPVHTPPSCRYRHLTGDSGIELCPCPNSSEGELVKELRASATQPDLEDHSPCALPPEPMSQVPSVGLASSYGDIP